ncbi:MAG: type II secretion system protein GspD, partial [Xanthomonadales bacterium]|nr:type II secretion system protein GspD [Xanthomonadales bacterium]
TFNDNAVSGDQTPSGGGGGGRSSGGFNVAGGDEEVRITAVEENNSLLIQASSSQYKNILTAIERLDVEPLQVLIEAQVIEVALNDQLQYGVNWFLSNFSATGDNATIPGLPEGATGDFVSGAFGGSSTSTLNFLSNGGDDLVRAVVTTLDSVSDVRTLSAPTLLVRNNSQARINVGQQISVQSASFNPNGNTTGTIANTQFISTGTTLDVTPRVNPGGLVYMEVSQVVSSPGARPDNGGNPDISNSEVVTEVAVQSGQTILIGGLITDRNTESTSGLPFLSRIPIIGGLFGSQNNQNMRNELVVLITPTVVNRVDQLQRVSNELKQKFVGLQPLIQQEEQQSTENNGSE